MSSRDEATTVEADTGQVTRSAAEVYEERFVPALFGQFADGVLEAAEVQPGDHVLDVGCGTGVVARAALRRVGPAGSVTAVDVDLDMLAVAARTTTQIAWQRVTRRLALSRRQLRRDGQFALVFVPNAVAALREMARVTRPGGGVAVAVWSGLAADPGSRSAVPPARGTAGRAGGSLHRCALPPARRSCRR